MSAFRTLLQKMARWLCCDDDWTECVRYLSLRLTALSEEERRFVRVIERRLRERLPMLEQHGARLRELEGRVWQLEQW